MENEEDKDNLVDTDEEATIITNREDTGGMKTTDEDMKDNSEKGSETNMEMEDSGTASEPMEGVKATNVNGKRLYPSTLTSSILRKTIRAKHSGSMVRNPYTPVIKAKSKPATKPRTTPLKDCETQWRSRFTVRFTILESSNALEAFTIIL